MLPGRDGYRAITHISRRVIESITPVSEAEITGRDTTRDVAPNDG